MLSKKSAEIRQQIAMVSLEDLIPEDHLLRAIENAIDFSFIYDVVKDLYSENNGRPSIDPVVLVKIAMIQVLFGISSMRQTVKDIQVNTAYRWFLGYGLHETIPHFTTFGKNYVRRFRDNDLFEQIFARILMEAINSGFVKADAAFIDGTHVKASANKGKYRKEIVLKQSQQYKEQLLEEIAQDRANQGKKPLKDHDNRGNSGSDETKEVTVSTTDPECGLFVKGEHERCFAYTAHVACDRNNFILAAATSPGNVHDSIMFADVYSQLKARFEEIKSVVVDAGYKNPSICKAIIDDGKIPVMPYKRPMTKEGFFRKHDYVYDEYYDCYICPNNQVLSYSTTNRHGYREYKSNPRVCSQCPKIAQCTQSKNHTKLVQRHLWEDYLEEAEHLRYYPEYQDLYKLRSQTIERVFADAKEKHGMRYTRLRGLKRVHDQLTLIFACMNLKKLAMWKKKNGSLPPGSFLVRLLLKLRRCNSYNLENPLPAF